MVPPSLVHSGSPRAAEVGGLLKPRRDGEQRAGLLGEQPGQRPVERAERRRGVQQRARGALERDGAAREQPRVRRLARKRRPRPPGPLGGELLVEALDARRCGVARSSDNVTAVTQP